ncbi:MAG: hypothetical protein K8L99_01775 [Anaerolineae bacterium]|nr:hypothetical protein [Anaerolineae bacterium]
MTHDALFFPPESPCGGSNTLVYCRRPPLCRRRRKLVFDDAGGTLQGMWGEGQKTHPSHNKLSLIL